MIEIRRADRGDWRILREVRLAALRDSPDWFWSTYQESVGRPEEWWRSFVDAGTWFIAWDGDRPVGLVAAIQDPDLEESHRQLISMWVSPEARGQGVGTRLVETVKNWARDERIQELQLEVTEGNERAALLYESCGFVFTGRTVPLPRDPGLIEREMRLRL